MLLRTYEQLENVIAKNPFIEAAAEEKALYVMFLADLPSPSNVANLDPDRSPPDTYKVLGKEIYLNLVNGAADTKLTNAYFDKQLATTSTAELANRE